MPIYVYRCQQCRETFERLVPMSANSATAPCRTAAQKMRANNSLPLPYSTGRQAAGMRLPALREVAEAYDVKGVVTPTGEIV